MKTINLTNPTKSEIKYHVDRFPDGELSIVIDDELDRKSDEIDILCRISSMNELFVLLQVADILSRQAIPFVIHISYLMSMRMDRVMSFNRPFSLRVVANMLKNCGAEHIYVLEPHSSRTLSELNAEVWDHWVEDPFERITTYNLFNDFNNWIIVFPDAGAKAKYVSNSSDMPVACFTKKRDLDTGAIVSIEPELEADAEKVKNVTNIILIDDLCDGGGTFAGIASYIKKVNTKAKLGIMVVHMVNPRGIKTLSEVFDEVIITNSYKDWDNLPNNVTMFDVFNEAPGDMVDK